MLIECYGKTCKYYSEVENGCIFYAMGSGLMKDMPCYREDETYAEEEKEMTREELKEHCKKQVESCEMWAKRRGEEPSGNVYEEHKMILDLLEQESSALDIVRNEVDVQEKWLSQDAGYSAYCVEIAFDAIRHTIDVLKKEMEEK